MASPGPITEEATNYLVFRECVSSILVAGANQNKPKVKRRAHKARQSTTAQRKKDTPASTATATAAATATATADRGDPEELAEFIDFIATEIYTLLPEPLRKLTYTTLQTTPVLSTTYHLPLTPSTLEHLTATALPPTVTESLAVYALLPESLDPSDFLARVVTEYIPAVTRPPPVWAKTRTEACEICDRDWIPLSYHHLIPRSVHAKVLKKGWHEEWMLNSVAWLCRACHSFVHRMAGNEELAREWFTVERILEREDVREWAAWVGRVRWKAR